MESFTATRRFASAVITAALLAIASGCGPEPPAPVPDEPPTVPADDLPSSAGPPSSTPASNNNPGNMMTSYEVAIAIAAANRRKAEAACDAQSPAERESCLASIAAEWNTTRTALDDLRGEQH